MHHIYLADIAIYGVHFTLRSRKRSVDGLTSQVELLQGWLDREDLGVVDLAVAEQNGGQ